MLAHGLDTAKTKSVWQPFLDWVGSAREYSIGWPRIIGTIPARRFWDAKWLKAHWPELALPNPNGNPLINLKSPDGGKLATDTFRIGDRTFLRLGLDVPYGRPYSLFDLYTPILPKLELDVCRDPQPGPPLGVDASNYSAVGNDLPAATIKLGHTATIRRGK